VTSNVAADDLDNFDQPSGGSVQGHRHAGGNSVGGRQSIEATVTVALKRWSSRAGAQADVVGGGVPNVVLPVACAQTSFTQIMEMLVGER